MTNSEMERVMSKLVSVTEFLAEEIAELISEKASRGTRTEVRALNTRVKKIKKAALQLRVAFDEFQ
jgi:hypothetical protein